MEQKNIPLNYGIHRSPSIPQDGQLSECVNLTTRDGELKNIIPPQEIGRTLNDGEKLIFLHATAKYRNYITTTYGTKTNIIRVYVDGTVTCQFPVASEITLETIWQNSNGEYGGTTVKTLTVGTYLTSIGGITQIGQNPIISAATISIQADEKYNYEAQACNVAYTEDMGGYSDTEPQPEIYYSDGSGQQHLIYSMAEGEKLQQMAAVGNTIIITTNNGMHYALFKDGVYKYIGQKPPETKLVFGLDGHSQAYVDSTGVDTGKYLWMIQKNESSSQWSTPVRVNKESEDTHDGEWKTYVFKKAETSADAITIHVPSRPSLSEAGLLPDGWLDIPDTKNSRFNPWCMSIGTVSEADGVNWSQVYILGEYGYWGATNYEPSTLHFRFRYNTSATEAPSCDTTEENPTGWSASPPLINTDESVLQTVTLTDGIDQEEFDMISTGNSDKFTFTDTDSPIVTNAVMACVNQWTNKATEENKFVFPFFVRYAYRLFDGTTNYMQSAPILMIPNSSGRPLALIKKLSGKDLQFFVVAPQVDLQIVKMKIADALADWKDIITAIDIFVSPQFYNYDPSGAISHMYSHENYPYRYAYTVSRLSNYADGVGIAYDRHLKELVWSNTTLYGAYHTDDPSYSNYVSGHAIFDLPPYNKSEESGAQEEAELFNMKIRDNAQFYLFKSFSTDPEEQDYISEGIIEAEDYTLSNILFKKQLEDDYQTHDMLLPTKTFVYNSRLNISNITRQLFSGFPAECQTGYNVLATSNEEYSQLFDIYIYLKGDDGEDIILKAEGEEKFFHTPDYIYYPDTRAYKAVIVREYTVNAGKKAVSTVKLQPHKAMNGAYWFSELTEDALTVEYDATIPTPTPTPSLYYPNKIYTSAPANPFFFPLNGINSIGTGEILATSTITKALSQGQFGQFQLYVFASDGIYAMTVDPDTGLYSSVNPVSRDVCNNPEAITQTDNAVVFTTEQGLKILQQSDAVLISLTLDGPSQDPTPFYALGITDPFMQMFVNEEEEFLKMLKTCRIAYDYPQSLLHIYPKTGNKHYVYSIQSGQFSTFVGYNPQSITTAWPDTVIQIGNELCRFQANADNAKRRGMLITRPLSMDDPFAMKLIADMKLHRHHTHTDSSARYALYASNNGINYTMVTSLRRHAFKLFKIVVYTDMYDDEALSGIAVLYETRRTNKLR